MKRKLLWVGLMVAMVMPALAWRPSGWVYFNGPYAYDHAAQDWYWLGPNNVQWANGFPPASGWRPMNQTALAQGWSWHAWPYAYSHANGAWYFFSANGRQKCVNLRTGVWSVFGVPSAGDYLVIDLSAGPDATAYPVSFLPTAPPGGWTDEYRTSKLVLRRLPAGSFVMGSPETEAVRQLDETQHKVTLTRDFYLGVFEVTQRQWELVMGNRPGYFNNDLYYAARPVEQVSYYDVREDAAANAPISPHWPQSSAVGASSFIGKLRSRTGLATLDLPTAAQWEYACRAGTTTALNSGLPLTGETTCPNLAVLGRYWGNGGSAAGTGHGDTSGGTAKVGSYTPNTWGLYDMHGNVWEYCLDWTEPYPSTPVVDPKGAAEPSSRVCRGGSFIDRAGYCSSSFTSITGFPDNRYDYFNGFRLARTVP